ncbi:MAG TPA: ABC transporter permease [Candidatus Fournierella merdavium]|nr:ABC transporter permease [Candidatus Fournierella merdavium]
MKHTQPAHNGAKRSNTWYLFSFLVKNDIKQRYQGSVLGILWSIIVPLIMLAVYTFIFSEVFSAKWNVDTDNKFEFALMLFCGLNLYTMFSDVLSRSVGLIQQNQNYVKKVVFPLEILPGVITFSALFNCLIGFGVLILANTALNHVMYVTMIEAPLVLVPHIVFCCGIAFLFSALSVYVRDLANFISVLITILMYMSPVFFPLSAVPERFRAFMMFNPMTYTIENMRNVVLYGNHIEPGYYAISFGTALIAFLLGYWVFHRAKSGFADLL